MLVPDDASHQPCRRLHALGLGRLRRRARPPALQLLLHAPEQGAGLQGQARPPRGQVLVHAGVLGVDPDHPGSREAPRHGLQLPPHRGHREPATQLQADDAETANVWPCSQAVEPPVIARSLRCATLPREALVATKHLHSWSCHCPTLGAGWQIAQCLVRRAVLPEAEVLRCLPDVRTARPRALEPAHGAMDLHYAVRVPARGLPVAVDVAREGVGAQRRGRGPGAGEAVAGVWLRGLVGPVAEAPEAPGQARVLLEPPRLADLLVG
mmetsp:Transcript_25824/g.81545  ORF Transcript_25824/g.81545 Transcript_25824/m.81545 type:complete len:267 (-) Transcript_25824:408-1208(-)